MNDLISRQAAIESFEDTTYTKNEIRRRITELPSAQPERKKGKWEMVSQHENPPTYLYSCSECQHKSFGFYNYCPNCGARMEGES